MRRLQLLIESELHHVALMAMAVNKICSHFGMDEVEAYHVELCVSEAVTNAIVHAYRGSPGNQISLVLEIEGDRLDLDFSDTGAPMRAEQANRINHGLELAERRSSEAATLPEGGRGLQIMRDIMDEVVYVREGQVNRLRMTKRLRPSQAHPPSLK